MKIEHNLKMRHVVLGDGKVSAGDADVFLFTRDDALPEPLLAEKLLCKAWPDGVAYSGSSELNAYNVSVGIADVDVVAIARQAFRNTSLETIGGWAGVMALAAKTRKIAWFVKTCASLDRHRPLLRLPGLHDCVVVVPSKNVNNLEKFWTRIENCREICVAHRNDEKISSFAENSGFSEFWYDYDFNYAKLHNEILKEFHGRSKYAILMNDDVEFDEYYLNRLMFPFHVEGGNAAIVGCKLLFPNGTIQHAGVELSRRHGATHLHRGEPMRNVPSWFRTDVPVTFALVGVDIDKVLSVGGFDENLAYDFNDIDLCIRCMKEYDVVFNPFAVAVHHESLTRITDGKCGVVEEITYFKNKHRELLKGCKK